MFSKVTKIIFLMIALIILSGLSAYLTINLIIKSEDTVVVPDLTTKNVVHVLEQLTHLGLNTKVKAYRYSADVPKHHIIAQEPEAGAEIKKGRDIRLIISKGRQAVLMPKLTDLRLRQAEIIISGKDLRLGTLTKTHSGITEADAVMAQIPAPGSEIIRGAVVHLLVGIGPRPHFYKMAELTHLPLDEAIYLIENKRLILGQIKTEYHPDKPLNAIISQYPLHGYPVAAGSKVDLVINRSNDEQGGVVPADRPVYLFRYRTESGFLNSHFLVKLDTGENASVFFDGYVKPGKELWLFIPREPDTTIFIYKDDKLVETLNDDS
jgi:serine/threonine-protein kinase